MRRTKLVLAAAALMVAMLMALSTPALAHGLENNCCDDGFSSFFGFGFPFNDGDFSSHTTTSGNVTIIQGN